MLRNVKRRSNVSLVKDYGYIKLSAACIKANQSGFFALNERVNPESFDGNNTNIDASKCFFGGRKLDIAVTLKDAESLAAKGPNTNGPSADGNESGNS